LHQEESKAYTIGSVQQSQLKLTENEGEKTDKHTGPKRCQKKEEARED
jgi:hypothetical protein